MALSFMPNFLVKERHEVEKQPVELWIGTKQQVSSQGSAGDEDRFGPGQLFEAASCGWSKHHLCLPESPQFRPPTAACALAAPRRPPGERHPSSTPRVARGLNPGEVAGVARGLNRVRSRNPGEVASGCPCGRRDAFDGASRRADEQHRSDRSACLDRPRACSRSRFRRSCPAGAPAEAAHCLSVVHT